MTRDHNTTLHRSPAKIRSVQFSHRIRGLDEYEVAEYLDLLADQVQSEHDELTALREDNDRLRDEVERLRAEVDRLAGAATDNDLTRWAAAHILHAQEMADALVEEAVRRSREMLALARAERRAMIRRAEDESAALLRGTPGTAPVTSLRAQRSWQLDSSTAVWPGLEQAHRPHRGTPRDAAPLRAGADIRGRPASRRVLRAAGAPGLAGARRARGPVGLLELHEEVHEAIGTADTWSYYRPGSWMPHCTLAMSVECQTTVAEALGRWTLPIAATVGSAFLTELPRTSTEKSHRRTAGAHRRAPAEPSRSGAWSARG